MISISLLPSRFFCISFTITCVGWIPQANRRARSRIGSGPNGLSAAILLARAGIAVTVYEAAEEHWRRCARSANSRCPASCTTFAPPCIPWPPRPLASNSFRWRSSASSGSIPPPRWPTRSTMVPPSARTLSGCHRREPRPRRRRRGGPSSSLRRAWRDFRHDVLAPLIRIPRPPLPDGRFRHRRPALRSPRSPRATISAARAPAPSSPDSPPTRTLPLEAMPSAGCGPGARSRRALHGWPIPRGGSQRISDALAGYLLSLGGEILTDSRVTALPSAPLVMCDVTPRQFLAACRRPTPGRISRRARPAIATALASSNSTWALDGPIPWRAPACARAGTVHLGGTLEEIAQWEAPITAAPSSSLAQPSLFDRTRAPAGKHTAVGLLPRAQWLDRAI